MYSCINFVSSSLTNNPTRCCTRHCNCLTANQWRHWSSKWLQKPLPTWQVWAVTDFL